MVSHALGWTIKCANCKGTAGPTCGGECVWGGGEWVWGWVCVGVCVCAGGGQYTKITTSTTTTTTLGFPLFLCLWRILYLALLHCQRCSFDTSVYAPELTIQIVLNGNMLSYRLQGYNSVSHIYTVYSVHLQCDFPFCDIGGTC